MIRFSYKFALTFFMSRAFSLRRTSQTRPVSLSVLSNGL